MWGAPRSGRCHPERSHWGKTWPRRKCVGLRQSVASARWHFCHVGPSTPIAAVRANCQYWLVSLPRQHRASHLLRVIVFPVLVAISLSPITGATVSEASAGEKPVTPLVISRVRSSNVVYVLATTGCAQPSCLRLLRTTVNAESFTSAAPPPVQALHGTFTGTLRSMQFANVSDGYAIVGATDPTSLYVTLNGARTWHRVTIQKGATTLGLTTTAKTIYAITGVCSPDGVSCRGYRIARSPLSANRWTSSTMPIGRSPKTGVWGFPYVPAAFGSNVWISEQPPGPAVIFFSRDGGRSFRKLTTPKLGSVNACGLTPESAVALWADCPTGMQESFFFSNDAGASWTQVPQQQFMGTGGGFFDPATTTLAYLDYGATSPLVRITTSPRMATTVGVLSCSKINSSVNGLIFTNTRDGLALCSPGDDPAAGRLEKTSNGGSTWLDVLLASR